MRKQVRERIKPMPAEEAARLKLERENNQAIRKRKADLRLRLAGLQLSFSLQYTTDGGIPTDVYGGTFAKLLPEQSYDFYAVLMIGRRSCKPFVIWATVEDEDWHNSVRIFSSDSFGMDIEAGRIGKRQTTNGASVTWFPVDKGRKKG